MPTYTTRMALTKPSGSASPAEAVDVSVINTNMDAIDEWMGCILVNDGVTPATADLFDGAIVKERTSGIIWEARKNGGGTFDKVYIRYPFAVKAYRNGGGTAVASGTAYAALGYDTLVTAECKNSSLADFVSTRFVVPIEGIYHIELMGMWASNATGARGLTVEINSGSVAHQQDIRNASSVFQTTNWLTWTQHYEAGTTICGARWQNSGSSIGHDEWYFYATLVEPTQ